MALGYNESIRNDRLTIVADAINFWSPTPGKLRIYDGTRPATGASVTTQVLLAEVTFSDPMELSITGGILTANDITGDTAADDSGTATWFRVLDGDNNFVLDGNVGISGSDLNLNTTSLIATVPVEITSFVIAAGNA